MNDQKAREAAAKAIWDLSVPDLHFNKVAASQEIAQANAAIDAFIAHLTADLPDRVREIALRHEVHRQEMKQSTFEWDRFRANVVWHDVEILLTALATANARHAKMLRDKVNKRKLPEHEQTYYEWVYVQMLNNLADKIEAGF